MFKQIAPQRAQNSLGFIVQIGGRDSVQYLDQDLAAEIKSDLTETVVPLYVDTLIVKKAGNILTGISPKEAEQIIDRIKAGLDCLGVKYELSKNRK